LKSLNKYFCSYFRRTPKNILRNYPSFFSSLTSAVSFLAAGFFFVSATSASILSSSHFSTTFFAGAFGASCKAFRERPILFLVGSKLIIFAVTSSHTFT
jgi:hypothetical protein